MSDLIADFFTACSHFYYSRIHELSEFYQEYIFLSFLSRRPRGQAKRSADAVNRTLLEWELAQDHIPTSAPLERSPHGERNGADRYAVTAKGTDS